MGNARDAKSIAESKPDAFGQDTDVLLFTQEAIAKVLGNTTFKEVLLSILQAVTSNQSRWLYQLCDKGVTNVFQARVKI